MTKITTEHLARSAIVYIRQSTPQQVTHNLESQRRQYALVERGRQLGWGEVQVIDDDLGRTGDGAARPGFEKLLAAICEGRVGVVLSIEASRLARNGRDWHTLLEFCGVVDTLIVDEDGIYDSRLPNDRLLLGMKGTMSEMEVSILRQRAGEARKQKARRGELLANVAVGFLKTDDDRIEKEPDRRVQEAIALVFRKLTELQSARQVFLWMMQERILLPAVTYIAGKRAIEWRAPSYRTVYHILTNPVYSGAYAFGRRSVEVKIQNGRKRTVRNRLRHWKDWNVLIKDHHEGYISWEEFECNQRLLADNANRRSNMGRGSVRRGEALLAGLFRCARCGKKLQVSYSGDPPKQRYVCPGPNNDTFGNKCISFGGLRSDRAVAQEILDRLQPLGIEAALAAIDDYGKEQSAKRRQLENALEQARFEAARAYRQYDQVDPDYRLAAGELERRWNEKLVNVRALEEQLAQQDGEPTTTLSAEDRQRLLALGTDLPRAWDSAGTTVETRKRILRLLIDEIIVDATGDKLELILHWHGGDHSRMRVKKNKPGQNNWVTDAEVVELVRVLARRMRDEAIASILNRSGKSTGRGNSWTSARVASLRNHQRIAPYREGERAERGEVTIEEAAEALTISPSTVLRMINDQVLPAQHLCKGAPWIIRSDDLKREDVRAEAKARCSRRPSSGDPRQRNLDL
jgi:DNA invertase Pin-like site-specific DNA recombinase/sulfur carrier protein ThiS